MAETFNYYPHTLAAIRTGIESKHGVTTPDPDGVPANMAGYILWMAEQVKNMDSHSLESAIKAARWIGWMSKAVEDDLKLWDNQHTRDLIREDRLEGRDGSKLFKEATT